MDCIHGISQGGTNCTHLTIYILNVPNIPKVMSFSNFHLDSSGNGFFLGNPCSFLRFMCDICKRTGSCTLTTNLISIIPNILEVVPFSNFRCYLNSTGRTDKPRFSPRIKCCSPFWAWSCKAPTACGLWPIHLLDIPNILEVMSLSNFHLDGSSKRNKTVFFQKL